MNSNSGRVLAIDIGTKRVGAAISDETGLTMRTLGFLSGSGRKEFVLKIKELVDEYSPRLIVAGLPLNMDGSKGPMAEKVEKFIAMLETFVDVPIKTIDERLSTKEAENILISADMRRSRRREVIDGMAASIILQKFLDRERLEKNNSESY